MEEAKLDPISKSMEIIAYGGDGKSMAMMAIAKAREGAFAEAEELLEKAEASIVKSHQLHSELLFYDAEHQDLHFSMLMVHAADHLTSADIIKEMAAEFIHLYKEVKRDV